MMGFLLFLFIVSDGCRGGDGVLLLWMQEAKGDQGLYRGRGTSLATCLVGAAALGAVRLGGG